MLNHPIFCVVGKKIKLLIGWNQLNPIFFRKTVLRRLNWIPNLNKIMLGRFWGSCYQSDKIRDEPTQPTCLQNFIGAMGQKFQDPSDSCGFNANLENFVKDFGKIVENSDSEKFGCKWVTLMTWKINWGLFEWTWTMSRFQKTWISKSVWEEMEHVQISNKWDSKPVWVETGHVQIPEKVNFDMWFDGTGFENRKFPDLLGRKWDMSEFGKHDVSKMSG